VSDWHPKHNPDNNQYTWWLTTTTRPDRPITIDRARPGRPMTGGPVVAFRKRRFWFSASVACEQEMSGGGPCLPRPQVEAAPSDQNG
jgi:hypothetical protein